MSTPLKIALLCNNKMALPALERMASEGVLCSIATADKDSEVALLFRTKARELSVPYFKFAYKDYASQLGNMLNEIQPDTVFVMTFPWRLPATVLSIPKLGFLNFHYGLLPEMRGADPIFESIRQRRQTAGVTVHMMDEGFDTGPIVMREEIPLVQEYTYGMLSSQLSWTAEKMCTQILKDLKVKRALTILPQDETKAKYWPRINEDELLISWNEKSSGEIIALVRSCNPVAKGVPTILNGWKIGICDVSEVNLQGDASAIAPGTILAIDNQNGLIVCCKDGRGLKLDVVYTGEGVLPGYKLGLFGVKPGTVFS